MKKLLLSATLLAFALQLFAQRPTASSYFGLKAAANFSSNSFKDPSLANYNVKSKTGFAGGIFYNISISEMFSLQPELLYSQMGSTLESTVDASANAKLQFDYASLPILVKWSPIERLAIFAGPQLNFITLAKINYDSQDDVDDMSQFKGFDFAATVGAEFWITKNFGVYGRYILGLTNQNEQNPGPWFNGEILTSRITNTGFQLGVTVGFPSGASAPKEKEKEVEKDMDSDGDGVLDKHDKCPATPGIADNLGCPEMILYYQHAEATLDSTDMMNLDKVVTFLNNNPTLHIVIEGYSSSPGEAKYNQTLSEKRANASMDYLASKGIAKERMKAIGHGEKFPAGDNDTEEGRMKSRRVVIKIAK